MQVGAIVVTLALAMTAAVGARGQNDNVSRQEAALMASKTNSSLRSILETLRRTNMSGSLELSGHCNVLADTGIPELPHLRSKVTGGGSAIRSLREMFEGNIGFHVSQGPNGIIRVVQRGVQTDILNVRISHISFSLGLNKGTYSANTAVNVIMSAPEVKLFMQSHNIGWLFGGNIAIGMVGSPPSDSPHLSGSMDDTTVSGALDRVLRVFPGLWIYDNCPGTNQAKRIIYIRFYKLQDAGNGTTANE